VKSKSEKINPNIQNEIKIEKNNYRYLKSKPKSQIMFSISTVLSTAVITYNNIIIMQDLKLILDTNFEYRLNLLRAKIDIENVSEIEKKSKP